MKRVFKYVAIGTISVVGLLGLNYSMLQPVNNLNSKVDGNNTMSLLKEIKTEHGAITFSVESNIYEYNKNSWDDGIRIEADYFKKGFLDYKHSYGDAENVKVIDNNISINNFQTKDKSKSYFYGYISNPEIKEIALINGDKKEIAEIIGYYGHRFWVGENKLGEGTKVQLTMNDGSSIVI